MQTNPDSDMTIDAHQLPGSDGFPNNPVLPLLVYRQALTEPATEVQRRFESHGWRGTWQNGVFPYHHFHSNAHEVLGITSGSARLQFGGPSGPVVTVEAGDVAILPAGTGHKRIEASSDFLVVGGYPAGQEDYDLLRGNPGEQAAAEARIATTPLPLSDPVYGKDGPLLEQWRYE